MKTFILTPKEGLFIPSHENPDVAIPAGGAPVPDTSFYRRYVARGEASRSDRAAGTTPNDRGADDGGADDGGIDDGGTKAPKGRKTSGRDAADKKE